VVGSVLVDILMYVDHLPMRGGDTIAHRTLTTSGGGFNVLIGASRLGMPASYAGRVGNGPMGTQVQADLAAATLPLLLPRVVGEDTGFDIGLVEASGERTFVTAPGVESHLSLADLRAIELQAGDAIYLSGYDLCYPVSGAALEAWLPTLAGEYLVVIDPGPLVAEIPAARLERVLARTDILSLNAREIHLLTGKETISEAAHSLVPRLADGGYVVARVGEEGCWLASASQVPLHISARPTQVLDTTGAGDAHVAALLARLAVGDDIRTATSAANVAASLAIERRGPATGPTAQELQAILAELQ
jgi:sugar/nucleoside kinase (ribokinase family)